MELRAKTIRYSKEKRSKLREEEKVLQKELQELDRQNFVTTMSSIRKPRKNTNPLRIN